MCVLLLLNDNMMGGLEITANIDIIAGDKAIIVQTNDGLKMRNLVGGEYIEASRANE